MQYVSGRSGRTVLFVSHNMNAVRQLCSHAILLDAGQINRDGTAAQVVERYFSAVSAAPEIDLTTIRQFGPRQCSRLRKLCLQNEAGASTTIFSMNETFVARIQVEITQPVKHLAA